jgi:TP901 family phage tail tape measure protein
MTQVIRTRLEADVSGFITGMRRAKDASKDLADTAGKRIDDNRAQFDKLGTSALLMGSAVGLGVGAAVKTYADFDKQMSAVASSGDDARLNIDALRAAAIEMGADTAFSATEAAQGVENLAKAGLSSTDILGGGLKGSLDLAAAGQMSVADSAEIAATALTQFNLEGSQVPHIADLLAAGAGKAQGDVDDLGQALNQSGLVASQFGLTIEETVGGLSAFASAGLLGSDAGTSFKTMLLALANPAEKTKNLMTELGINAYDAQGNFVGLESLAGQLKTQLGDLDQATRDQALAQIFGNDAVRAANVLYDQGAEGIAEWTKKVDDQGYAAETAAEKTNNLIGDLERFRGAIDSSFIQAGGAGAEGLRPLVQGATDLVDKFNELGPGASTAVFATAAVSSGALLALGGVAKLVGGVRDLKDNFDALAPAGSRGRDAITSAGKAAGIAAIAFIGLQVAGVALEAYQDPAAVTGLENTTAALKGVSAGADGVTTSLDELFKAQEKGGILRGKGGGLKELAGDVDDLASAFTFVDNLDANWGAKIGYQAEDAIAGLVGMESQSDRVSAQFEILDQSLMQLSQESLPEAQEAFKQIASSQEAQALGTEGLINLFPQYLASLKAQAAELGDLQITNEEYAAWMGGKVPEAVRKASEAAGEHGRYLGDEEAAMRAAREEALAVEEAFVGLAEAQIRASGSAIGMEQAIDDASQALKDNGKELDLNEEAGRSNRSALDSLASATLSYRDRLVEAEASSEEITAATKRGREEFIRIATQMGMTEERAKDLADQYGLVPDEISTRVETPGATQAEARIAAVDAAIAAVSGKNVDITVDVAARQAFARDAISAALNVVGRRAEGGPILNWSGAGRRSYDTELVKMRVDEHVWTPEEVDAVGGHSAMYRMRKMALDGELRGFKDGGTLRAELRSSEAPDFDRIVTVTANRVGDYLANAIEKALPKDLGATPLGSGDLVSLRGHRFTENFANRLLEIEKILGYRLNITQGGFRPATSYSGTSHQGDAVDIAHPFSSRTWLTMRNLGIAAWDRTGKGNWIPHIHGVPASSAAGRAGGSAVWQAQDYRAGGDGLANGGVVNGIGGPRDDLNWRRLSDMEYVVNAESTRMFMPLLDKLNYAPKELRAYLASTAPQSSSATAETLAAVVQAGQYNGPSSILVQMVTPTGRVLQQQEVRLTGWEKR